MNMGESYIVINLFDEGDESHVDETKSLNEFIDSARKSSMKKPKTDRYKMTK
jgi:hypothetical protein